MFSLLTNEHKKELVKEYHLRLAVMSMGLLLVVAISAIVFLLPTYLRLKSDSDASNEQAASLQKLIVDNTNPDLTKALADIKKNLPLATLDGRSAVKPIVNAIADKPQGISLTGFEYGYDSDASTLKITGIAATRESLKQYGATLSADKSFKNVDLPISNFAKSTDLEFSISVSGSF